jgi:uncharacterized protein YndB with AHSA1/START domain
VVDINVPRAKVYEALTTQKGLLGWWTTKVETDGKQGSVIDFTFEGDFNPDMRITQFKEPEVVGWTGVGGHDN